jgi:hypothetical protein
VLAASLADTIARVGDSVDFDVNAWPLVVMRMPAALDLPAIDGFIQGIDSVLARKAKFSAIVDTTALRRFPDAVERRRLVEQLNLRTFTEKTYNVGNGVVIVSATARAVLTAINWVRPPATTQHLVGTFPEALEWCCGRLVAAGVGLSPGIQALREKKGATPAAVRT